MPSARGPAPISWAPSQFWDGIDGDWSTFLLRVGTPEKAVRVLPSTAGSATWVITSGGCTPKSVSNCVDARGGVFETNQSSTWVDQGIQTLALAENLGHNQSGAYGLDTLALGLTNATGGPTLPSQIIAGIETNHFYTGMFGLHREPMNLTDFSQPFESFLSSLKSRDLIPSLSWAYTAGARYRSKGVFGSLTFGGSDISKYRPNNISFSLAPDLERDLVVGLQGISAKFVNGTTGTLLRSPTLAFIDSTVPYIYLPEEACKLFESQLGLVWEEKRNLYLVNENLHQALLTSRPEITFRLGNDERSSPVVEITLPYESFDLVAKPPLLRNSSSYFPLRRGNESQITLGRTFLQETYVITDYERRNFTVTQALFDDTASPNIVPIPWNATSPDAAGLHLTRNAKIGVGVGTSIAGLLLAVVLAHVLRRWWAPRKKVEPTTPSPIPPPDGEPLPTPSTTPQLGSHRSSLSMQELHDQFQIELLNAKAVSGSGNQITELQQTALYPELATHTSRATTRLSHRIHELPARRTTPSDVPDSHKDRSTISSSAMGSRQGSRSVSSQAIRTPSKNLTLVTKRTSIASGTGAVFDPWRRVSKTRGKRPPSATPISAKSSLFEKPLPSLPPESPEPLQYLPYHTNVTTYRTDLGRKLSGKSYQTVMTRQLSLSRSPTPISESQQVSPIAVGSHRYSVAGRRSNLILSRMSTQISATYADILDIDSYAANDVVSEKSIYYRDV